MFYVYVKETFLFHSKDSIISVATAWEIENYNEILN